MALRPLDPSIVNAYQAPKFNMPDPLQDVAALEQIKSGRVSRQLNEQQLAQLQRDSTALDEMRKFIASKGGPENLDVAADAMINTGIPNIMDAGIKIKQKLNFQKNFNLAMSGGTPAPAQPAPVATTAPIQGPVMSMENLSGGGTGVKMRSNLPEQAPAPASTNALGFPTNFGENTMAQLRQLERQRDGLSMLAAENPQITPMVAELSRQIAELRRPQTFSPGQTVYVPGQAPFTLPSAPQRPVELGRGSTMVSPTGEVIARGAAPEAPAPTLTTIINPKNPSEKLTVDARTGKVIGVADTAKPLSELQQLKLQKDAAADLSSVNNSKTTTNELQKLADELLGDPEKGTPPHPGLSGITGMASKIPNLPSSNAAKAQQKLETFKGKIKTFGRQLASQEGKLGNMAVQEWKFISDSVESIDPYAGNLDEQLRNAVRQARDFASRMQEKYELSYEGVNVSPRSAAKSAGAPAAAPAGKRPLSAFETK
jgi:hypothetical protein